MKRILGFCLGLLMANMANAASVDVGSTNDGQYDRLRRTVDGLLDSRNFVALDGMAQQLRQGDVLLPGGRSELYWYYVDLASYGASCSSHPEATEKAFAHKRSALSAWLARRPKSLAAHIVMAELLLSRAYEARTCWNADHVTQTQWDLYRSGVRKASKYIANLSGKEDPYIYTEMVEIAKAEPDARALLDGIYQSEIETSPRYFAYYADRADMLQTKWYGAPGELASYTRSLISTSLGDDGQVAYAFAAGLIVENNYFTPGALYGEETGLTWADVKKAYEVRQRRYGLDYGDWNRLLFFALMANDFRSGADYVNHVGNHWAREIWRNQAGYDATVKWAHFAYGIQPRATPAN